MSTDTITFPFSFEPKLARKGRESVAKNGKEELTRGKETLAALEVTLNNFLTKKIRYFVDFTCLQINYANF